MKDDTIEVKKSELPKSKTDFENWSFHFGIEGDWSTNKSQRYLLTL